MVSIAAFSVLFAAGAASMLPSKVAMPFLCLERCTQNSTIVNMTIAATAQQSGLLGAVVTERYNLGAGGKLLRGSNLTDSVAGLRANGWPAAAPIIAMVSSYPYPIGFATWMRQVFADPDPFVEQLLAEASEWQLGGFNIDWEPVAKTVEPADAGKYATFLGYIGQKLSAQGLSVTVDVATWSPLWNYKLLLELAAPHLDGIMVMSTYTDDQETWVRELAGAEAAFGASGKLIVGLETERSNATAYPAAQLQERFAALSKAGLHRVGLWKAPVPAEWDSFLQNL
jgi:hypothetical protein